MSTSPLRMAAASSSPVLYSSSLPGLSSTRYMAALDSVRGPAWPWVNAHCAVKGDVAGLHPIRSARSVLPGPPRIEATIPGGVVADQPHRPQELIGSADAWPTRVSLRWLAPALPGPGCVFREAVVECKMFRSPRGLIRVRVVPGPGQPPGHEFTYRTRRPSGRRLEEA